MFVRCGCESAARSRRGSVPFFGVMVPWFGCADHWREVQVALSEDAPLVPASWQ